jgi:hypothetical protein
LIFNGLLFYGIFTVALRWLYGNRKTFDFQRFANITQTLDLSTLLRIFTVLGGWVKGRVLSKG